MIIMRALHLWSFITEANRRNWQCTQTDKKMQSSIRFGQTSGKTWQLYRTLYDLLQSSNTSSCQIIRAFGLIIRAKKYISFFKRRKRPNVTSDRSISFFITFSMYSNMPNKRTVSNNHTGCYIRQKLISAQCLISAQALIKPISLIR